MKKLIKTLCAVLAGAMIFGMASCSGTEFSDTAEVSGQGVCRIVFNSDATITEIKLKGTNKATAVTKVYGDWADAAEVSAASVEIPAGSYVFTLSAQYDGSLVKGTCEGDITAGKATSLSFTLVRNAGDDSDWGDDDDGEEGNEDGELPAVEPSAEGLVEFTSVVTGDLSKSSYNAITIEKNMIINGTAEKIIEVDSSSTTIGSTKYSKRLKLGGEGSESERSVAIYVGANRKGTLKMDVKASTNDLTIPVIVNGSEVAKAPYPGTVSAMVKADENGYLTIWSGTSETTQKNGFNIYSIYWTPGNGSAGGVDKVNVSEPQLPVIDNSAFAPVYKNGKKVGMRSNIRDINTDEIEVKLFVAPSGSADGDGTKTKPLDLQTAINQIPAGGAIVMKSGKYKLSSTVRVSYDNCGSEGARKYILPETGGAVLLDFSSQPTADSSRGFALDGSYWHIYGLTCYNAGDNGMYVTGKNNIVERCVFQGNQDTGLQIARRSSDLSDKKDWPANNLILNCTSFDNKDDKTGENADGFASKLTCGDGNVFDGCISFANCDDGWDLYAKPATGPIGVVTIRNCVALQNGKTTTGTNYANGDMNGFKLGGSSNACPTPHVVENCVAFLNGKDGFTDNGNGGALSVSNCSSYGNVNSNFNFYRTFAGGVFTNLISMVGSNKAPAQVDKFGGKASECSVQATAEKVLYIGAKASKSNTGFYFADSKTVIGNGDKIGTGNFADPFSTEMKNTTPPKLDLNIDATCRNTDGTVNLAGFLEAKEGSVYENMGAHFGDEALTVFDCGL